MHTIAKSFMAFSDLQSYLGLSLHLELPEIKKNFQVLINKRLEFSFSAHLQYLITGLNIDTFYLNWIQAPQQSIYYSIQCNIQSHIPFKKKSE